MLYYSNEYQLSIKLCLFLTIFFQNSCLQTAWILLYYTGAKIIYAPVAQLDRVTDSDSVGRWFESSRAYHRKSTAFDRKLSFYVGLHAAKGRSVGSEQLQSFTETVDDTSRPISKVPCGKILRVQQGTATIILYIYLLSRNIT